MAVYMKFGDIKGSVTAEGFKDQIDVQSFQFGVGRGISTPTGGAKNRETSQPSVSEITLTKSLCAASAGLYQAALSAAEPKDVEISFVHADKGKVKEYLVYKLTDVLISGYSISSGGDGKPSESISLNFTKIEVSFTEHTQKGAGTTPFKVIYDIAAAKTG